MKKLALGVLIMSAVLATAGETESRRQESVRLHTELAAGYFARAQYGVALEELQTALDESSDYAPAYDIRGLVYSELGEFDNADKNFKRALSLSPNDFDINHNYGWFLCNRAGKPLDAVHYFMTAVKNPLYQTPQKSILQAGLCALKGGDLNMADEYLHQADRILPNDPTTMFGFATLAYARGEYPNARALLDRVNKATPPTAETLWLGIRIERKLGGAGVARMENDLTNQFPQSDEARKLAKGQFD